MEDLLTTRPSLLVRIRDLTDNRAWEEFVQIYTPLVYRYLRRSGLQDSDAASVSQDVLWKVARSIDRFEYDPKVGSFRGWLMTVTRSRLAEFYQQRQRAAAVSGASGDSAVMRMADEQAALEQDRQFWETEYRRSLFEWAVEQIRDEFQEATWQAFWQTSVEGQSAQHAAQSLGVSVGAVYIARSRVLARLKKQVRQIDLDL